jgi:DNA-binding NtrC family response regulator
VSRDQDHETTRAVPLGARASSYERLGRVRFKILTGPDAGRESQVAVGHDRTLRGGRSALNDIVLQDDLVSGFHFSLEFTDAGIILRDLGSTNGVFVHGVCVREALIDLDAVMIVGATHLQITGADRVDVSLAETTHFGDMYGWHPVMRELFVELERLAALPSSNLPVLVTGETGTGKELVARGLHERSARANGPFIVLDCTALPHDVADAIVFGYNRGAFTGAIADQPGVFELAHGGTLFIDELGELPLDLQAKLLRVLDHNEVSRLNERNRVRKVDVRIISATNRDLRRMVAEGRFRQDLYFRVLGKHVKLPSLRERGDDVVRLAERFLRSVCAQLGVRPKELTPSARAALLAANWAGNVRQLRKVIECAAQLTEAEFVDALDLNLDMSAPETRPYLQASPLFLMPWEEALVEFQREYMKGLMQRVGTRRGWIKQAAALAGMDRTGFVRALRRLGLSPAVTGEPVE